MAGVENERRHSTGTASGSSRGGKDGGGIFNRFFGFVWGNSGSSKSEAAQSGHGSSSGATASESPAAVGTKQKRRDEDGSDTAKAAKRRRMTMGSGGRHDADVAQLDSVTLKGERIVEMSREELLRHLRALGLGCGGARPSLVRRLANAAQTLQRLRTDWTSNDTEDTEDDEAAAGVNGTPRTETPEVIVISGDDEEDNEEEEEEEDEDGSGRGEEDTVRIHSSARRDEAIFAGFVENESSIDKDFAARSALLLSSTSTFPLSEGMSSELLGILKRGVRTGQSLQPRVFLHPRSKLLGRRP